MSAERLTSYRLRAVMTPMAGTPVNWNARAIIWSGNDRRYWLRLAVGKVSRVVRSKRSADRRYKVAYWLNRCIDNRPLTSYTAAQQFWRRVLNTQADVDARRAWTETNRYWRATERRRADRASR